MTIFSKCFDGLEKLSNLGGVGGLIAGYSTGRQVAGDTAAGIAPKGRVTRSERIARNAAIVGAPVGGVAALALARKHKLAPRLARSLAKHFPDGVIGDSVTDARILDMVTPAGAAMAGSAAGGLATGGVVGGVQRLRGPLYKTDQEKNAGVLKSIGKALTTPIPGTKPWVIGRGAPAAGPAVSGMRRAVRPGSKPPISGSRRTSSGAYDVSDLARQMGIIGKND